MNPGSSSTPSRPPAPGGGRLPGTGFTPQQKLILALSGILVTAWIVVAVVFVLSGGVSGAWSEAAPSLAGFPGTAQPGEQATFSNTQDTGPKGEAILISAACAQANGGAEEGTVIGVDGSGLLEVSTTAGAIRASLAGITLSPGSGPLETLASMVSGQPVLLVRDLSTRDETGTVKRYVFTRSQFVNHDLVRQGIATLDPGAAEQSCAATFQLAEQKARSEKVGMWAPTRVPTLTFVPQVTLDHSTLPVCDCSIRYECSDFSTHAEAQACYNACNDYNSRLDLDRNGIACEELP